MPKIQRLSWQAITLALGTYLSYAIGQFDDLIKILAVVVIVDFITGILASIINEKTSSNKCFKGIVKKCCYLMLVIVGHSLDVIYPQESIVFRDS